MIAAISGRSSGRPLRFITARLPRLTAFVALALLALSTEAAAQGAGCDRACLRTMLDQYLNAVIKHDPAAAPLFVGFRQTENAVVMRLGTGVWKSMTALGKVQRRFFDPVTGQAGYFGLIEESGAPAVTTLRLRVQDRRITEAEWVIARKDAIGPSGAPGSALVNPDSLIANPPPEQVVATDKRSSREAMIAAANSYFDGLTTHDGSIIMHHPGCIRIENGTVMTGPGRGGRGRAAGAGGGGRAAGAPPAPAPTPAPAPAPEGRGARQGGALDPDVLGSGTDCASNLANINISNVAARRYPIVDEEAGAVLGLVIFQRKAGTTTPRNLLTEWFWIDDNKIRSIYAAMFFPAPDVPAPNWPPYDGNFPPLK